GSTPPAGVRARLSRGSMWDISAGDAGGGERRSRIGQATHKVSAKYTNANVRTIQETLKGGGGFKIAALPGRADAGAGVGTNRHTGASGTTGGAGRARTSGGSVWHGGRKAQPTAPGHRGSRSQVSVPRTFRYD